jgi:hypothetical protein
MKISMSWILKGFLHRFSRKYSLGSLPANTPWQSNSQSHFYRITACFPVLSFCPSYKTVPRWRSLRTRCASSASWMSRSATSIPCFSRPKEAGSRLARPDAEKRHENHGDSGSPQIAAGGLERTRPITTKSRSRSSDVVTFPVYIRRFGPARWLDTRRCTWHRWRTHLKEGSRSETSD